MRVIAHGSHSARVYTLTKTSVPSTLLRCLELFPNSFSHRSFKSARVVWWMKVWAAERISHSHWSLLDRVAIRECVCLCSCVCVCVKCITAGHWGSLLTVEPSLDHLTPTWPLCLAPTAEQRVLLAQAADWWLSSPLLAVGLDPGLSTTGQSRTGQQGRLNVTIMYRYCCDIQLICWWCFFFLKFNCQSLTQLIWPHVTL